MEATVNASAVTVESTTTRLRQAFDDDDNSLLLTRCIEKAIDYILDCVGLPTLLIALLACLLRSTISDWLDFAFVVSMHVLHRHQQRLVAEQEREDERAHAQEEEGAGTLESGEKEREDAGVGRVTTVVEEDEGEEPVAEDSGSEQAAAQTRDANVTVHTDAAKLAPTDATADQTPTSTIPNAATPEQPTKRKKRKSRRSKKREHAADSSGAAETPTAPAQPDVYEGMIPNGLPRAFRGIKVETATYRMMWAFWHILMMHAPAAAINPVGGPVLTKRFSAQELYAFAVAHDYGTALVSWQKTERTLLRFVEQRQFPDGFTLTTLRDCPTTFSVEPRMGIVFEAKLESVAVINRLFDPPFTL